MFVIKKIYGCLIAVAMAASTPFVAVSQDLLGIDGEESTSIGVFIKDMRSGEVLYDYNSDLALTPASVMKSVTSATALSLLGESFQFKTPVVLSGHRNGRSGWAGDLIVRSSGDPTLESEHFKGNLGFCDSIAVALRRMGVTEITGNIVVEQTLKDAGPIVQWEVEDLAWPYGAGLFGLNYRDNTFTVWPLTGETKPFVPGLEIDLRPSADGNDLVRGIDSDRLVVYARSTTNKKWSIQTTMPDPSAVFASALREVLTRRGIKITPGARKAAAGETTAVYTHYSPRLRDILRSLMVRSDNLFAEGVLRAIAPADSRRRAIEREKDLWTNRGVNADHTIINDGSGLTRANRLSPRFIADVLLWMAESRHAETYVSFFPRAGIDGTMRSFLAKSPLKGKIAMKTGSVSSVQCYAGYKFDDEDNPTHIIVVMVNGFFCKRASVKAAIEDLLSNTFLN